MNETILLVRGANETELLRTLSRFGKNTLGLRVMDTPELAEHALFKGGVLLDAELITKGEAAAVILGIIKDMPFFAGASYADAVNIYDTLSALRGLITGDEKTGMESALTSADCEFAEKDAQLLKVYKAYMRRLEDDNRYDLTGLERLALERAPAVSEGIVILDGADIPPLGLALADKLSSGRCKNITLRELFGAQGKADLTPAKDAVTCSSGRMNEAKDVLAGIAGKKLPYDRCVVACADTASTPMMFYDLSKQLDIPMTFGCGLPISCTFPAGLLKVLCDWCTKGMFGVDGINAVIFGRFFDSGALCETLGCEWAQLKSAVETAGRLRLSFSHDDNDKKLTALLPTVTKELKEAEEAFEKDKPALDEKQLKEREKQLKKLRNAFEGAKLATELAKELEKGLIYLIDKYAVIRKTCVTLDTSAKKLICTELTSTAGSIPPEDMLKYLAGRSVCHENSKEGHLHITGLTNAPFCLREQLFITGLTSDFPGTPKENYLICDNDMLLFSRQAPVSTKRIADKKRSFRALTELAGALGCVVNYSYAGFDTAELKTLNASSVLFEFMREQGGVRDEKESKKLLAQKGYFSSVLSPSDIAGRAYAEGSRIAPDPKYKVTTPQYKPDFDREFSITTVEKYIDCQKKFYYLAMIGLGKQYPDDPFAVISPTELGTLLHDKVMEASSGKGLGKAQLAALAGQVFDEYLTKRPPIDSTGAGSEKNSFISMAEYASEQTSANTILGAEDSLEFKHRSGYTIKGRLDSLEQLPDNGGKIIVDYKTGYLTKYQKDDFDTCAQIMLYAYMLEKSNVDISFGEYLCLRSKETVTCTYDDDKKSSCEALLDSIAESIKTNTYKCTDDTDMCKKCEFAGICKREEK